MHAWPEEHVTKCLVSYHPDDEPPLRQQQEDALLDLYHACRKTGHELMLEIIPPPGSGIDAGTLPRALERLYARGVFPDWWKLQPIPDDGAWQALEDVISHHDTHCRGVLLLGLDAPVRELERHFSVAAKQSICKGFAIGRSIFSEPAKAWFLEETDDDGLVAAVAGNYRRLNELWQEVC